MLNSVVRFIRLAGRISSGANRNLMLWQSIAGVVALILGFWGWMNHAPPQDYTGWFNNLFRTIQLITLQFPTSLEQGIPWQLHIARLAVPLVAALATFNVLVGAISRPVRLAMIPSAHEHIILIGSEQLAVAALKTLADHGRQIVVMTPAIELGRRETLESLGFTIVEADPHQPATLAGLNLVRATAVFLTHENDLENIDLTMQVVSNSCGRSPDKPPLILGVLIADDDLARELDATLDNVARAHNVRYHRLCPDRDGLREDLRTKAPVFLKANKTTRSHVLIVGLEAPWEQSLMQVIISSQDHPDLPALFTIVASGDELAALAFWRSERPDLSLIAEFILIDSGQRLLPTEDQMEAWRRQTPTPQIVIVLRPDSEAVATTMALRRFGSVFGMSSEQILVRRSQEDRLLGQLAGDGPKVTPFGGLIRAAAIERVLDLAGEDIAIALHAHYLENATALGAGSPAALAAWDGLPENLRDANRASADHISILFTAVNLEPQRPESITPENIETMARIEHRRWIADRIDRGWRSGAKRDNIHLIHPSIQPFDALSHEDQEKDRNAVRVLASLAVAMPTRRDK